VDVLTAEVVDLEKIQKTLNEVDRDRLPPLFWSTAAWALYLNLSRDDVSTMAMFPVVRMMIERINEMDSEYFFAMPSMFEAMLYSMSPMFGGNELKAEQAFDRVEIHNEGKFLLSKVLKARFFCTQFDRPQEGKKLLQEVLDTDPSQWTPRYNFMNMIARRKAELYLEYSEEIF
jgi:hypothetical protein